MSEKIIFPRRLLLIVLLAAVGAFVVSLYLLTRDDFGADKTGPSSFSRSAIGYEGLARLLDRLGATVIRSRRDVVRAAQGGLLVVAEPHLDLLPQTTIPHLPDAERILLILPKWGARPSKNEGWISAAQMMPLFVVQRTLRLASDKATLERREDRILWQKNAVGIKPPSFGREIQLIRSEEGIKPLVAAREGILLGEIAQDGKRVWILSDPDMLSNQAFGDDGRKIEFAVALVQFLNSGSGQIVFDETVHGFTSPSASLTQMLFQFPYNVLALQVVAAILLILWGAMGRFGVPEPAPQGLAAGKEGLVGNVAHLMEFAGHEKLIIRRYIDNTIREVALHLRAPKDLSQSDRIQWLQQVGDARGVTRKLPDIITRTDRATAAWGQANVSQFSSIARDVHRWKQEIINGHSEYSRRHGRGKGAGPQSHRRSG